MKIKINDKLTIADIQKEFISVFPYLKIQFFKNTHKAFEGSPKKEILSETTKLKEVNHLNGEMEISESLTVNELEAAFKEFFNLNVQVFRKSGSSWLETTLTDNWTLKKQNQEGMELSNLS